MRIAAMAVGRDDNRSWRGPLRNTRHQKAVRTDHYRAFNLAKLHPWTAQFGRPQARSGNTYLSARQRQSRRHRFNVRSSIHVLFTQDTVGKSHDTQLSRRKAVLHETFTQISTFECRVSQL